MALTSHMNKIVLYIINNRLQSCLCRQISSKQAGLVNDKAKGTEKCKWIKIRMIRKFNITMLKYLAYFKAFERVRWIVIDFIHIDNESRLQKFTKIWLNRNVFNINKMRLVRTFAHLIVLYAFESRWRKKIEFLKMWCWRKTICIP